MPRYLMMIRQWIQAPASLRAAMALSVGALLLTPAVSVRAAAPPPAPPGLGVNLGTLRIGTTTYHNVRLLSVNARTIVIAYPGGMASIRLRDLPPNLQVRFGYRPGAGSEADENVQRTGGPPAAQGREEPPAQAESRSKFEDLLQRFGQKPGIEDKVDLRPRFFQFELGVKEQGRRPSCAVFAVVSALEYQNAEVTGQAEKFSEEYLIWATRKILGRTARPPAESASGGPDSPDDADEGFSLFDVVLALRAYGVPLQSSMPNTLGRRMGDIEEPSPDLIEQAQTHRRIFVHQVPGHDTAGQIDNIITALNAGVPVAIGLRWPNYRTLRAGYLSEQTPLPGAGHAVTLVGYEATGGRAEDAIFMFKNSYGPAWGEGGYGRVTFRYLMNHLRAAVVLEVEPPKTAR